MLIGVDTDIVYRVKVDILSLLPPFVDVVGPLPLHVLLSQVDAMLHIILGEVLLNTVDGSLSHIYALII